MALPAQAATDSVMVLEDENFFLQDEVSKLRADLADKENIIKKLLLEAEVARRDVAAMTQQKGDLESKIDALQKMILARDDEFPAKVEQAALPYRVRMEEAVRELEVRTMAFEQKTAHVVALVKEMDALEEKVDLLTGEKLSLLASLRKISAERDDLKARMNGAIADARSESDARVKDFQVRLAAEQTLVQEKISQAKKPLENKLALMEAQYKMKEAALRENAAKEVAKLEAASAAQVKDLKQQLDACRKAASSK